MAPKSIDQLQNMNSPSHQDFRAEWQTQSSSPAGKKQSSVSSHQTDSAHAARALSVMAGKRAGRGATGTSLLSMAPQEQGKDADTVLRGGGCLREEQALEGALNVQFQTSFSSDVLRPSSGSVKSRASQPAVLGDTGQGETEQQGAERGQEEPRFEPSEKPLLGKERRRQGRPGGKVPSQESGALRGAARVNGCLERVC